MRSLLTLVWLAVPVLFETGGSPPLGRRGCLPLECRARTGVWHDSDPSQAVGQVIAFEQAVRAGRWVDALDFVWPAKITTRWTPPFDEWRWSPPSPPPCTGRDTLQVLAAMAEGRWARVRVATCPAAERELWLLQLDGRWKILRRFDIPICVGAGRSDSASLELTRRSYQPLHVGAYELAAAQTIEYG